MSQTIKCLSTTRETRVLSLGQEDPLEKEMATHSSTLAWKIPRTEEPGRPCSTPTDKTNKGKRNITAGITDTVKIGVEQVSIREIINHASACGIFMFACFCFKWLRNLGGEKKHIMKRITFNFTFQR